MRVSTKVSAAILAIGLLGAACSPSSGGNDAGSSPTTQPPADPVTGGALSIGLGGSPDGFSPANNRWTPATYMVAKSIYDPIAVLGTDGNIHPYLAESITPSTDFKSWTFKLRPGIKFHNGEALDATAFKANVDSLKTGVITRQPAENIASSDIVDPLTVKVNLVRPAARLTALLTGQAGYVVAPEQLRSTNSNIAIGTGPFKLKDWVRDSTLTLDRNPDYWRQDAQGNKLPYLTQLTFKIIADPSSRQSAATAGDVDLAQTYDPNTVIQCQNQSLNGLQSLVDTQNTDKVFLTLNNLKGPFVNRDLRQAASEAVDRAGFIETLLDSQVYKQAPGPMSPGSPWGNPDLPQYNPEHAKQLVAAAAAAGKSVEFSLTVLASDSTQLAQAQYLQQKFNDVGFKATISTMEVTAFSLAVVTANADMFLFTFWTDTDPDGDLTFFDSKNAGAPGEFGLNFARWKNAQVDAAADAARASTDDSVRKQQYQIIWDQMAKDVPYVFIYVNLWCAEWRPNVYNFGHMTAPDNATMPGTVWGSGFLTNVWIQKS